MVGRLDHRHVCLFFKRVRIHLLGHFGLLTLLSLMGLETLLRLILIVPDVMSESRVASVESGQGANGLSRLCVFLGSHVTPLFPFCLLTVIFLF
jgi:hypothetical protein